MIYKVTYIDDSGVKNTDIIYGNTLEEIYSSFNKKNKVVLKIKRYRSFSFVKSNQIELSYIMQALADVLKSGMSLSYSLYVVGVSLSNKSVYKPVFLHLYKLINEGVSFVEALKHYRVYFGETTTQMLISGYETGNFIRTLEVTSYYLKELHEIKREMFKRLVYPIVVFLVSIFALIVNVYILVPRMMNSEIFKTIEASATTQFFVYLFKLISILIPVGVILLGLSFFGFMVLYKINQVKFESLFLKIPFLRELIFYRSYFICFFSLSKLLSVGIKLSQALKVIENSTPIKIIKREFNSAYQLLAKGESFVKGFKHISEFEKQILLWSINTDRLIQNIESISNRFYEKHIASIRKIFPVLYSISMVLVLGVFILIFSSVFLPYFKVINAIGR